jgi:hypothetical protein
LVVVMIGLTLAEKGDWIRPIVFFGSLWMDDQLAVVVIIGLALAEKCNRIRQIIFFGMDDVNWNWRWW